MNLSRLATLLCLALLALFPAGCQRPTSVPVAKNSDPKLPDVAVAFVTNNSEGFWVYAERGCQAAAKDLNVKVVFRRPSQGTASAQQEIIKELLITGIKGIAISPNDAENSVTFLRNNVFNKKIPLVTQDNDLPESAFNVRRCYIGTHNYRAGRAAGALVKKALPQGGKIAIFVGQLDAPNAQERRQGVLDFLAGKNQEEMTDLTPNDAANVTFGDFTLVATRTDDTKEAVCKERAEELLRTNPDVDCLIGLWEYNPPALLRAVNGLKTDRKKPAIVAFDENFATLDGIRNGDIVGTIVQNPYLFGYESVKILTALARGDEDVLKNRKDIDAKNRIFIPHRIIVRGANPEKIANAETIDVNVFYPEVQKLRNGTP
jgi:ribose transport system substrate-binding protein